MAGEKIYYIEDEPILRNGFIPVLQAKGYDVAAFPTVDAALAHMGWRPDAPKLTENLPDAIITDNRTPGTTNGLDMLRAAKDANIPRMMLSADIKEHQVTAAGGSQAKLFYKPCDENALLAALAGMVAVKGSREL